MAVKKYTCLLYGEGKADKEFLIALTDLQKFKYHTKKWSCFYDNARGASPSEVLRSCRKIVFGYDYELVLCFVDLDKLKPTLRKVCAILLGFLKN